MPGLAGTPNVAYAPIADDGGFTMDERRWRSGSSRGSASTQLVVLAVLVGIIVLVVVTSTTFLSVRGSGSEASPSGQGSVPLTDFTKRCVAAVDDLDVAEVLLDQRPDMRLNEASRVRLTIGPAGFAPIESEGEMSPQGEVRVSCTIDARLRVVSGDAEVEPADWETQQYVPPAAGQVGLVGEAAHDRNRRGGRRGQAGGPGGRSG